MSRFARGFERLRDLVPEGADVEGLHAVVGDDVPDDVSLRDVLGEGFGGYDPSVGRENLPRIRPVLVALAARAAGATRVDDEVMFAAEMLHLALGLHDIAFGRRGGKRRWLARKVMKRSVTWIGGNHLTLRALELTRHTRPEVLGELVDTLRAFADGQELLRELQQGSIPTADDWLEHADSHTGALFSFCCRAGGLLARAEQPVITSLGRYGRHLGRLWHVAEDVSMLEHGDAGAHLVARALAARPMLPVVCAGERDPMIAKDWAELVRAPEPEVADRLSARVAQAGGLRGAREVMVRESWAARKAIATLDDTRYRRALDRLAQNLARSSRIAGATQTVA